MYKNILLFRPPKKIYSPPTKKKIYKSLQQCSALHMAVKSFQMILHLHLANNADENN